MGNMSFRMFTWPNNPEHFEIEAVLEPEYETAEDGAVTYTGLGPLCRIIRGSGVFIGKYAHESFNALQVIMATKTMGELNHPVWGTCNAYLTELKLEHESRPEYVSYSFTFREVNENGTIPKLPEYVTES